MTDEPLPLPDPMSTAQRLRALRLAQAEEDFELAQRRLKDADRELAEAEQRLRDARAHEQFDSAVLWIIALSPWTVSTRPLPPKPEPPPPPPPPPPPRALPVPLQRSLKRYVGAEQLPGRRPNRPPPRPQGRDP